MSATFNKAILEDWIRTNNKSKDILEKQIKNLYGSDVKLNSLISEMVDKNLPSNWREDLEARNKLLK